MSLDQQRPSAPLVWARAAVLGGVVVLVGATSHLAAGGLLPGPVSLAVLLVAATALGTGFLRGPATGRRIVLLVVAGQMLVHTVLSLLAGHRGDATAGTSRATPSLDPALVAAPRHGSLREQYDAAVAAALDDRQVQASVDPVAHLVAHLAEQGPLMVLAHTAAAVAVGLWLALGEAALWSVLVLGAAALLGTAAASTRGRAAAVAGTLARIPSGPARRAADEAPPSSHLVAPAVSRRGPPRLRTA